MSASTGADAPRILVVEDEPSIRDVITYALRSEGYEVLEEVDGALALTRALREPFDLLVLDVMLPGLSGTEVCRRVRAESPGDVPIIMLSARGAEVDRVVGLEAGADDYLGKPFSTTELLARVRAVLRRRVLDRAAGPRLVVGGLEIDLERHQATIDDRTIPLTPSELRLLGVLAATPDRPVERTELVRALWSSEHVGDQRSCDTHIANLRQKLERDPGTPERLVTVRGVGYMLHAM